MFSVTIRALVFVSFAVYVLGLPNAGSNSWETGLKAPRGNPLAGLDLTVGAKEEVDSDDLIGFNHWRQFWSSLTRIKKVPIKDGDNSAITDVIALPRKGILVIEDYPHPPDEQAALKLAAIYKKGWDALRDGNELKVIGFALPRDISTQWDNLISFLKPQSGEIQARAPPPRPQQLVIQEDEGWWKIKPDTFFYEEVEKSSAGELARAIGGSPKRIRLLQRASDPEECDPSGPYEVLAFGYEDDLKPEE